MNITAPGPSRRPIYRCAAILWATALLIGSLQPNRPAHIHFGVAHQALHWLGFGLLAYLATAGFGKLGRTWLGPAAAAFLLGFTIELLQHRQYRIPIEWCDVRDDAIGILVVAAICRIVYGWRLRTKEPGIKAKSTAIGLDTV